MIIQPFYAAEIDLYGCIDSGMLGFGDQVRIGAAMELLINDCRVRQIFGKISRMLDEAKSEVLITGWIGTIFIYKFAELKKRGVQIAVVTGKVKDIREDPMQKEKQPQTESQ